MKRNSSPLNLLGLTESFQGPVILTDAHLGAVVYTRYGGFNPIVMADAAGKKTRFIYNSKGNLIPDTYTFPFTMPAEIEWPFTFIKTPVVGKLKSILHHIYRPVYKLKTDAKGDVIKAIYLRQIFRLKWCVIKQGKQNMWSDVIGRVITDRLTWQQRT